MSKQKEKEETFDKIQLALEDLFHDLEIEEERQGKKHSLDDVFWRIDRAIEEIVLEKKK